MMDQLARMNFDSSKFPNIDTQGLSQVEILKMFAAKDGSKIPEMNDKLGFLIEKIAKGGEDPALAYDSSDDDDSDQDLEEEEEEESSPDEDEEAVVMNDDLKKVKTDDEQK